MKEIITTFEELNNHPVYQRLKTKLKKDRQHKCLLCEIKFESNDERWKHSIDRHKVEILTEGNRSMITTTQLVRSWSGK